MRTAYNEVIPVAQRREIGAARWPDLTGAANVRDFACRSSVALRIKAMVMKIENSRYDGPFLSEVQRHPRNMNGLTRLADSHIVFDAHATCFLQRQGIRSLAYLHERVHEPGLKPVLAPQGNPLGGRGQEKDFASRDGAYGGEHPLGGEVEDRRPLLNRRGSVIPSLTDTSQSHLLFRIDVAESWTHRA